MTASARRAAAARQTIEALAAGPDAFETFFEQVGVGLALADLTGRYVRGNASYSQLVGRQPEDLVGLPLSDVLHADDPGRNDLHRVLGGELPGFTVDSRYVRPDGRETWVLHGVSVVRDDRGQPVWLAVSAQDITERRRAEEDLRQLSQAMSERAVRDPLTGLANRDLLHERLRASLSRDARTGGQTGLLFLDLDGFKAVNDRYGHSVGDRVLRTVADRLRSVVRPSDTVARLGGDEFVVLVEAVTEEGLAPLVDRLGAAVEEPVHVGTPAPVTVGVSIGIAVSIGGASDPTSLLVGADRDMYAAKRARQGG